MLTIGAGGVFIFDPTVTGSALVEASPAGAVAPVPEPGTVALFAGSSLFFRGRPIKGLVDHAPLAVDETAKSVQKSDFPGAYY